jgi:hypothetical protein
MGGCYHAANTPSTIPTPTLPDPHNHAVDVNQMTPVPEVIEKFKMVEIHTEIELQRQNVVTSSEGNFRAFTVCDPSLCQGESCCQDRLFVEDIEKGNIYEIQGLPLAWRPFSDLVWIRDHVLIFDRWSQPEYGIHYAVDASKRKIILASPFPDQAPEVPDQ